MFESIYIITMCVVVICIFIWMFIYERKLRKQSNQPSLKELNKIYKQTMKEQELNKMPNQSRKLCENIPLFMDKDEFLKIQ